MLCVVVVLVVVVVGLTRSVVCLVVGRVRGVSVSAIACKKPYLSAYGPVGCGQCMPCRIRHQRVWVHRNMLELATHKHSAFVTLTYDDDHRPDNWSLDPRDLQLWLKRFRSRVEPLRFRFFAAGEYGEDRIGQSGRPHYHLIVYGFRSCLHGVTRHVEHCCSQCDIVRETWGKGHVALGEVNAASVGYCAGYVVKKMTSKDDRRLDGRFPEFMRSSRRPGIGVPAVSGIADAMLEHQLDVLLEDVPAALRFGSSYAGLGRVIRRKLRVAMGRSADTPESVLTRMRHEHVARMSFVGVDDSYAAGKEEVQQRAAMVTARAAIYSKSEKLK